MSSLKDRMKARAQAAGQSANDIAAEAAQWETGSVPATPAGIEPTCVPITHILPDPIQPRRAMPELLRADWCAGEPIEALFSQWSHQVQQDFQRFEHRANWKTWIESGERGDIQDQKIHPDSMLWLELLRLANSIFKIGLEQPITIYPMDERYQIQVGERRLLAFLALTWLGYPDFDTIPAIIQEAYNPFAQALENGARENLNAIGRARQLAILLKALQKHPLPSGEQPGQSWYAEAADLRVPHGMADEVALMLGLTSPRMTRRYQALLDLPPQVWNWADQFNWTEGKLRGMMSKAKNSDQLYRIAQDEVTLSLGGTVKKPVKTPTEKLIRRAQSSVKAIRRMVDMDDSDLALLPDHERKELVAAARDLLRRLT